MKEQTNQFDQYSTSSVTRLLADYRARVYENIFMVTKNPMAVVSRPIKPEILVIEDNTDQWFLTRWALLQRFPDAHIQWLAKDSEVLPYLDACRKREEDLPRIILVDLYLPSAQHGLSVLQTLKAHPIYKPVPTLALSWSTSIEDMGQVFNYLADGYLVKPTNYQNWIAELSLLDKYLMSELKH